MRKKEVPGPEVSKKTKRELLDEVIAEGNKGRLRPVILKASDSRLVREVISTGNAALDAVLGGGLVKGLSVEIYGSAGAGKTSAAVMMLKQAQLAEPDAAQIYFASENDIPIEYFEQHQIDMDSLLIIKPSNNAEDSIDVITDTMRDLRDQMFVNMIVIDSVAALAPKAEVVKTEEQGLASQDMAIQARLMSKLHRVISGSGLLSDGAILLLINQERAQLGQTPMPNTTPGGLASGFFCKLRMRFTCPKSEYLTRKSVDFLSTIDPDAAWALQDAGEKDIVGHVVMVDIAKLNTGRGKPHAKTSYRVIYGYGVDQFTPILQTARSLGIISVGGPYYAYKDVKFLGVDKMLGYLSDNKLWPVLKDEVSTLLKDKSRNLRKSSEIDQVLISVDEETGEILDGTSEIPDEVAD